MTENNDRYESCEICKYVGVNLANEDVYQIIEDDSNKGCRISIITNDSSRIIREVRLSNRGKLLSYVDNNLREDN